MRRALFGFVALIALAVPRPALTQTVLGYQLGLVQSAGGTFGDSVNPLLIDPNAVDAPDASVQQVQGVQLNTTVTGNMTVDIVTPSVQHGFVFGVAATQLVPFATPDDAPAILTERTATVNAAATYLARIQEARWALQFGAGYDFGLNGRLQNGANGAIGAAGNGTIPAAGAGPFAFNAQTHAFNTQLQYQLMRARWDLQLGVLYNFTVNGLFTLAAGGFGQQAAAGAVGTNIGAFIPQNVHAITPQVVYRQRLDARQTLTLNANAAVSLPQESVDDLTVTGTTTVIARAAQPLPSTAVSNLQGEWSYNVNQEQSFGGSAQLTIGMRVPTDQFAAPLNGGGFRLDTAIWTVRGFYRDVLPWELRLNAGLGVAQATLFLPPLGLAGNPDDFDPVRSNLTPIFDIALQRRFEPVDVALTGGRAVGVGAFGASAIVTDNVGLIFTHVTQWETPLTTSVGFNASRTKGVGQELFRNVVRTDVVAIAFNNESVGANLQFALPLWREDPFAFDIAASYNFSYNNLDPTGLAGIAPISQHIALLALRGTFGRGAAAGAGGAGGRRNTDELDAFSANPRDGAPLVSARLLQQGAPLLEVGARPGQPPAETRRDSRQAYRQSIRQEAIDREARERSQAVQGIGTYAEEEERRQKAEKEKQERAKDERTRDFEPWPMSTISLPAAGTAPPPPPPPPTEEVEEAPADDAPPPATTKKKKKKKKRRRSR